MTITEETLRRLDPVPDAFIVSPRLVDFLCAIPFPAESYPAIAVEWPHSSATIEEAHRWLAQHGVIAAPEEPPRRLETVPAGLTVKMRVTGNVMRTIGRALRILYGLEALRHQLKHKGRPGWKRMERRPCTRWRV